MNGKCVSGSTSLRIYERVFNLGEKKRIDFFDKKKTILTVDSTIAPQGNGEFYLNKVQ